MNDAPRKRLLFRFSLRTLLIVVTLFSIWLGWRLQRAASQREAVRLIRESGGKALYDFEYATSQEKRIPKGERKAIEPQWLLNLLGVDFFHDVTFVDLGNEVGGSDESAASVVWEPLGRFSRLRGVFLYGAAANDKMLATLAGAKDLEEIYIGESVDIDEQRSIYPEVTERGLSELRALPRLRVLYINETPLDDAALRAICGITSLEDLNLFAAACAFTDEGLRDIASLTQLRELKFELGYGINEFSDEGVANLRAIESLEDLWIRGEKISDQGLSVLSSLPRLKTLRIASASITPAGIRHFEQHSPATLTMETYFNYRSELKKLVDYFNRRAPESKASENKLGLKADQMPMLIEALVDLNFDGNKARGEEFARRATALKDPTPEEFAALMAETIG